MYVVPGNHDLFGYNINTLPNTKLGLLAKSGVITILDRRHPVRITTPSGFIVGLEGQEYNEHIDEGNPSDYQSLLSNVDFSILVVHGMLLDHEFFNGVKHTEIKNIVTDADVLFAGHYHPGFKEVTVNDTTFCNPGSLLRIENTKENRANMPQVVILNIDESTGKFTLDYIKLSCAEPGDKVFANKKDTTVYDANLHQFHNKIKNNKFKGVDMIGMIDDYIVKNNEDAILGQLVKDKINSFSIQNSVDTGYTSSVSNIYITKVEIKNFQANKKRVVDFVDGLNVIKGESNSGKSGILRAIYWVLYDKPNGSDFITTGAKSCAVRLHLSNGYTIERKRSRTSSGSYSLISPDGKVEEFKGFSNNIPIEITNAHQMPELKINGANYRINIASQLDPAFLIGYTPGDRISLIGSLVDADRADEAKKDFANEKRRKSIERKQFDDILISKQEELKNYDYLEKLNKDIKLLESAIEKINQSEQEIDSIRTVYNNYLGFSSDLVNTSNKLNSIELIDKDDLTNLSAIVNDLDKLSNLSDNYNKSKLDIEMVNKELKSIPDISNLNNIINDYNNLTLEMEKIISLNIEFDKLSNLTFEFDYDLDLLSLSINEYKNLIDEIGVLNKLTDEHCNLVSVIDIEKNINEININLQTINDNKEHILEELKSEDSICPYCKQKIDYNIALH